MFAGELGQNMNAEGSRDPEGQWHVWYVEAGLSRDHAYRRFLQIKPRDYTFDTFRYDRPTGRVMTC